MGIFAAIWLVALALAVLGGIWKGLVAVGRAFRRGFTGGLQESRHSGQDDEQRPAGS